MKILRFAVPVVCVAAAVSACARGRSGGPGATGASYANAAPGTAPAGEVLQADPDDMWAAIFHDDLANADFAQVLAWDDSSHTGVFVSLPASMVAQAGSVPIGATTPGVLGRFGVSHEGSNAGCTRQWYFALYSGTLVVSQPAAQPGDTIAVTLSNATFEFVDEQGSVNPAVTVSLTATNVVTAPVDDQPIWEP